MKKLLTILLLLVATVASSQMFITMEPLYVQPGVAYFSNSLYARLRTGNIDEIGSKAHYLKAGAGFYLDITDKTDIVAGINYNNLNIIEDYNIFMDFDNVKTVSFEAGFKTEVFPDLYVLFLTDVLNWETDLGLAYKF